MPLHILLEIAIDSEADARSAASAGADRLELCSDLAHHGFTPTLDLIRAAARIPSITTVAMIRPASAGNASFIHSRDEWSMLVSQASAALAAGAGGLVFGCLTSAREVDESRVRELVRLAAQSSPPRDTVFHRAFDLTLDPLISAQQLADLGVTRVLTSGLSAATTAADLGTPAPPPSFSAWQRAGDSWDRRVERLATLIRTVGTRIQILPGGGLRASNAAELIARTNCTQLHSSARAPPGTFSPEQVLALRAAI